MVELPRLSNTDQEQVFQRFLEALEQFKCLNTEVNRVIVYSFDVEPKPNAAPSSWDYGLKVALSASTFEETVMTAGDGAKRYSYEYIESKVNMGAKYGSRVSSRDGRRENKQVPWTQQNEEFFIWIKVRMKELIVRLYELEEPSNLVETINAGRLLPLGNTEQ